MNELEKRAKYAKKHQKGLSPFTHLNAGDVEYNTTFFNNAMGSGESVSEDYRNLPGLGDIDSTFLILANNAKEFSTEDFNREFEKDLEDWEIALEEDVEENKEGKDVEEESSAPEKFILSKSEVDKVLNNILNAYSTIISKRPVNINFLKNHDLTLDDGREIIKQLSFSDYSYSSKSTNAFYLGNTLSIFVPDKEFNINGKVIPAVKMYIKIDDSKEGIITVISFQEGTSEDHPYENEERSCDHISLFGLPKGVSVKIWLDDVRTAPDGYYTCHSVNKAKDLIEQCESDHLEIEVIDCDHDLGDYSEDGGDGIKLLEWLAERETFYKIRLHTMNPVGFKNMLQFLDRYWR
jgi:hypothetical protein